jgi:hypothetical protein
MNPHASNVAAILRAGLDAAVDAVVGQDSGQPVGHRTLGTGTSLLRGTAVAGHRFFLR